MKRRVSLVIATAVALMGLAWPASAVVQTTSGYWGCAGSDDLDIGVCIKDPVPVFPSIPKPRLPQ